MSKRVFELDFHGRKLVVEHGELAKQLTYYQTFSH